MAESASLSAHKEEVLCIGCKRMRTLSSIKVALVTMKKVTIKKNAVFTACRRITHQTIL